MSTPVYSVVRWSFSHCFAVEKGETELYSILSRVTRAVPDTPIHSSLTYYSTEDVKTSPADLIRDNLVTAVLIVLVIVLLIAVLSMRSVVLQRKVIEEKHVIDDLGRKVYVDALTSVRNKGAFDNYIDMMQARLDSGEKFDFAVAVLDCDDLKEVNDRCGHDKGDEYLKAATHLICEVFDHSPVFRTGGDEFAVILMNDDFKNRNELIKEFEHTSDRICREAKEMWEAIHISMGVAVHDPETDGTVEDTVHRADQLMYEKKRAFKDGRQTQ